MTMADTVAVMNLGRIEQMGPPTEIYEHPRTVFVANFLGQSNLLKGSKTGTDGSRIIVSAFDVSFAMPASRNYAPGSSVIVGVRPEKLSIAEAGETLPSGHNSVRGRVTDASFIGVSTQYLVETAWGQELMVFEQNRSVGRMLRPGDDAVVHWSPDHTFGLDGGEDLTAGMDLVGVDQPAGS